MNLKKIWIGSLLVLPVLSLISFTVALGQGQIMHPPVAVYIPQRVYDSNEKRYSDFEAMLLELSRADVVFVGEQHNDPATHRLERAILEGLARRRSDIMVALEMFERDVQPSLDDYLAGRLNEEDFLNNARPWPGYLSDYRPLVELARHHNWRVIASNVPRRYASQVSKEGMVAIDGVPAAERKLIAAQFQCPFDDYFKRFSQVMGGHPGPADGDADQDKKQKEEQREMIERFYYAQCIKDETMAESIAEQLQLTDNGSPKPLVVHFNGTFHSDYHEGAAARISRRIPKSKVKVVTIVPLEDLDAIKTDEYRKRGDYIIFALKPAGGPSTQKAE